MTRLAAIAVERDWERIDFRCLTGTRRAASTTGSVSSISATGGATAVM
jgi:hypothetical protein